MAVIEHGDTSAQHIYHALLAQYAIDDDDDLRDAIQEVLELLERIGVVYSTHSTCMSNV